MGIEWPSPAWTRRLNPLLADERLADGAVALVGAVLALVQLQGYLHERDRGLLNAGLVLLQTIPLDWRRHAPFPVAAIGAASVAVQAFLGLRSPLFGFFGAIFAFYSLAVHGRRELVLLGFGAAAILLLMGSLELVSRWPNVTATQVYEVLDDYVLLAAAWILGTSVRTRRAYLAALEDKAALLEREREERARRAVADERARIARELHDVVAHSMSVMVVQAGAARRVLDERPERAREALLVIEATGRQALAEMRRLLGVLRRDEDGAPALAPQPGLEQLEALAEEVRATGLPVAVAVEGEPRPLPPGIDLSAYRIVQEGLTNAIKHAGPAQAWVVVRYGADALEVEVADDGRGPVEDDAPGGGDAPGVGLVGMRERVAVYGGDLRAGPRPGGGYAVRARLPFATGPSEA